MVSRRRYLQATGAAALGALAGCNSAVLDGEATAEPAVVEATNVHHRAGFGAAVGVDGNVLVVGAPMALTRPYTFSGTAFVYEREDDEWVKQARLRPPGEDLADPGQDDPQLSFGTYVEVADGTVVVGSARNGTAYTYQRSGSGWTHEQTVRLDVEAIANEQRYPNEVSVDNVRCTALAFDGETLVLAASAWLAEADGIVDSVHVFERNPDWREVAAFARENPTEFDQYGYDVAVDGDTVVAGGTAGGEGDDSSRSVVYTFERGAEGWRKAGRFRAESASAVVGTQMEDPVVLSGDTLAVGGLSPDSGQSSVVDVYDRSNGSWTRRVRLSPDVPGEVATFGAELALDETALVAGAPSAAVDTRIDGTAFRFERDDDWELERRYTDRDAVHPGEFGHSVALSEDRVAVGGSRRRDAVADRECIYVFDR